MQVSRLPRGLGRGRPAIRLRPLRQGVLRGLALPASRRARRRRGRRCAASRREKASPAGSPSTSGTSSTGPATGYPSRLTIDRWQSLGAPDRRRHRRRCQRRARECDSLVKTAGRVAVAGSSRAATWRPAAPATRARWSSTTRRSASSRALLHLRAEPPLRKPRRRCPVRPGRGRSTSRPTRCTQPRRDACRHLAQRARRAAHTAVAGSGPDRTGGRAAARDAAGPILATHPLRAVAAGRKPSRRSRSARAPTARRSAPTTSPTAQADVVRRSTSTAEGMLGGTARRRRARRRPEAVVRVMSRQPPRRAGARPRVSACSSATRRAPATATFRAGIAEYVALLPPNSHGEANPGRQGPGAGAVRQHLQQPRARRVRHQGQVPAHRRLLHPQHRRWRRSRARSSRHGTTCSGRGRITTPTWACSRITTA